MRKGPQGMHGVLCPHRVHHNPLLCATAFFLCATTNPWSNGIFSDTAVFTKLCPKWCPPMALSTCTGWALENCFWLSWTTVLVFVRQL